MILLVVSAGESVKGRLTRKQAWWAAGVFVKKTLKDPDAVGANQDFGI